MKRVKLFEDFLNEADLIRNGKISSKVYHSSASEFDVPKDQPMWFAVEKKSAKGWFENTLMEWGEAYQYEASVSGKIADLNSPEIEELFSEAGLDSSEWEIDIVGNPDSEMVMSLPGTKLLIKKGFDGVIYSEYDPNDWDNDSTALIVFKPSRSLKNFKLIKRA